LEAEAPSGIEVGALGLSHANTGVDTTAHKTAIETNLIILFSKLTKQLAYSVIGTRLPFL